VERFKIEIKGEANVRKLTEKFGDDFDKIIKHLRVQGWRLLLVNPDSVTAATAAVGREQNAIYLSD
jgi:predicted nuclease of restriction endonuclease-like RecB superfamily